MREVIAALLALSLLLSAAPAGGEVLKRERAVFEPFPREIPEGEAVTFAVRLRRGFRSPVLVMTRPNGETAYLRPTRRLSVLRHEFDVIFGAGPGRYRMELVVDSAEGDLSAAQFTICAGVKCLTGKELQEERRPESDYEPERPDEHPLRLERDLFGKINDYRRVRRLRPYPWLEPAAHLGREHLRDYLKMKPRPKRFVHVIPGHGSIADRFEDVYAWPNTVRKFPIRDPEIGPEATCYCSESLAALRSMEWLFREYFLRESAFRAPLISEYPSHAAVAVVRVERTGKLYTTTIFVQLNATRVWEEIEYDWNETTRKEGRAREGPVRAELLRRLGRSGDPRSTKLFLRRLQERDTAIRAAALDALYLNEPGSAQKWVDRQTVRLVRARRDDR